MKKLFVTMMVVVASLSVMATQTAAVRIKLVGSNPTYATSTLRLTEDNARTAAYESGYDAESMMTLSNPYSVLIYSYVETHPCEVVATNDFKDTKIGFTTNMVDNDYKLEFSNVSGTITLYDKVLSKTTNIQEGTSYSFSVPNEQKGQKQVLDRFVINYVPAPSSKLEACFIDNHLTITNNPWSDGKIAVYDGETKVVEKDGTETDIDLTSLLEAGKRYMVKFFPTSDLSGEPKRQLVIVP